MEHAVAHKHLLLHFGYTVAAVAVEYYQVVERGAAAQVFVFFKRRAHESFLAVDI